MILITYLGKNDIKHNKQKFLITLKNNILNTSISSVIIFSEIDYMLPKLNKVDYIVHNKYDIKYFIEKSKRIDKKSKRIIWSDPFVEFNYNLSKIKYNAKSDNYYLTFDRQDDISNNFNKIDFRETNIKFKINAKSMDFKLKMDFNNAIEKKTIKEVKREIIVPKIEKKIENKDISIEESMEVNRKIDVIIVSVNYNEYLRKSLKHNHKFFDNIIVVTHRDDKECMNLCFEYDNIKVVLAADIVKDGKINKSIGINAGIESIEDPDWILVMDADIILNKRIDITELNKNYLYGTGRYLCEDMDNYYKWMNQDILYDEVGKFEADRYIGYFQLFNYKKVQKYPESSYGRYSKSEWADVKMKQFFNVEQRKTLRLGAIHLGETLKEWKKIEFGKPEWINKEGYREDSNYIYIDDVYKVKKKDDPLSVNVPKNGTDYSKIDIEEKPDGISIIIPAYKATEFIEECIDSIFDSKGIDDIPMEVLIGIDACIETLEYIRNNDKIMSKCKVYWFEENNGPYLIRNTLLEISNYENIIFFDSDDIMKDNLIKVTYDKLKEGYDSVRWKMTCFEHPNINEILNIKLNFFSHGSFGVNRMVILKSNGFFPYKVSADSEFKIRMESFKNINLNYNKRMYYRRIEENSQTNNIQTGYNSIFRQNIKNEYIERFNNNIYKNPNFLNIKKIICV